MASASGRVAGFAHHLLCPSGSALEDRDPVVRAILDHVAREGPIRPGERVHITRFGGGHEHHRDPYAVLAGPISSIIERLSRPLAWSVVLSVDAEFWAPTFDYVAFTPLVHVDVAGLRHVAFGIDWRRLPMDTWLNLTYERTHTGGIGPPPATLPRPPALDRARFDAAVKAALQTLHRPDQLATNPLIGSALATTTTGPTTGQLRATIEHAVGQLGNLPKGPQLRNGEWTVSRWRRDAISVLCSSGGTACGQVGTRLGGELDPEETTMHGGGPRR